MKKILLFGLIAGIFLFACNNQRHKQSSTQTEYKPVVIVPDTTIYITLNDSVRQALLTQGRKIAVTTQLRLKQELRKAIKQGGTENAVTFCSKRAMEITDSMSLAEKVIIKRLAKKYRNPLNDMTKNESNIFKGYIISNLGKQWAPAIITWNDKGQPVYYNPMIVETLCLKCHGTPGKEIKPEVAKEIAELYPDDKATNFRVGDLRGMWSITFPEYRVTKIK